MTAIHSSLLRKRGASWIPPIWLIASLTASGLLIAKGLSVPTGTRPLSTKAIEDVNIGDYVLAKDPGNAGLPTPYRVTGLPRNWTQHIVHMQVEGGGELQATRAHPFWVDGRGWIAANALRSGDRLRNHDGGTVCVHRIWTEDKTTNTFNLTVDGVHTYFVAVGDTTVLVHNVEVTNAPNFDAARRQGFQNAGLTDPNLVNMGKPDAAGTYTEFSGSGGAKVAYDGPHADMNAALGHDKPHVGWQTGGKRGTGAAQRGNITYDGPAGPARPCD